MYYVGYSKGVGLVPIMGNNMVLLSGKRIGMSTCLVKVEIIPPIEIDHIAKNVPALSKMNGKVISNHGGDTTLDNMIVSLVKEKTSSTYDYDIDRLLEEWIGNSNFMEPIIRKMNW